MDWRKALHIATDILPKLPSRGDGALTILIKALAIADSVDKFKNKSSAAIFDFFDGLDAKSETNGQFVDLFFSTSLQKHFQIKRLKISDYTSVVKATGKLGTLYFIEWQWGSKPEMSCDFWHSPNFDFIQALGLLWTECSNRLHIALVKDKSDRIKTEYSTLPRTTDPLLGDSVAALEKFVTQHRKYLLDNVPRTYLFVGLQGTGKSTFALRAAEILDGRILRIDAQGVTTVGAKDLDFLFQGLKPDYVILDDIDRVADLAAVLPTLFTILTDLKHKHPKITVFVTINDITKLDPALVRPGRIDEVLDFNPLTREIRAEILQGYLKEFGASPIVPLDAVLDATEGLSAAYLREVALQFKYRSQEEILVKVKRMCELAEPKKEEDKKPATSSVPN